MKFKPSKKLSIFFILLLAIGLLVTLYEASRRQEIRQRAQPTLACPVAQAICRWDPLTGGVTRYNVTIKELDSGIVIKSEWISHPTTELAFLASAAKTYTCEIYAENSCGPGPKNIARATCPSETSIPTKTPTPTPSPTLIPNQTPTPTPTPTPTAKPTVTPTPTSTPTPTPTSIPTSTPTPTLIILPTSTPSPSVEPSPTPTFTPTPTQFIAQATPQPTLPPTGDKNTILFGAGGIILTIIGGILLFLL